MQGHVDDALAQGAKALTGGKKAELQAPYDKGYFFAPTVLSDCTIDMKVRPLISWQQNFCFFSNADSVRLGEPDAERAIGGFLATLAIYIA